MLRDDSTWPEAPPVRIFVAPRTRSVGWAIVCLGLAAGGTVQALRGAPWLWAEVAFMGFCGLGWCYDLVRPNRLVLTPTGFEATQMFTVRRRWTECGPIRLRGARRKRVLTYDIGQPDRPETSSRPRTSRANRGIWPYYRDISTDELEALMNDYRRWSLQQQPHQPEPGNRHPAS